MGITHYTGISIGSKVLKNIVEKIISKEADYFLALKGNQGNLHADVKDFFDNSGRTLIKKIYKESIITLLKTIFPNFSWIPWLFKVAPSNTWNNTNNHILYIKPRQTKSRFCNILSV